MNKLKDLSNKINAFHSIKHETQFITTWYNIGNKCYEGQETCFINNRNFEPYADYFKELNNQRRDKTFPTFVKRTNEKEQTIKISSAFLDDYLPRIIYHIQQCQVLDLGLGEGDLSSKVATYMKGQCNSIRYEGIDRSEKFVESARQKLITVGVEDQNIILGDCFGGDIDKLVDHPTLLIASQVIFYAPDINDFIDKIIKKMGAIAIIIGQSDFSFLNELSKKYAPNYKQKDTANKVKAILDATVDVNYINILYSSIIEFPGIRSVKKVSYAAFDSLTDQGEKEAREILEFVAAAPLEYLDYNGKLPEFIEDIKKHLAKLDGNIGFWNFMAITVPSKQSSEEELRHIWLNIQKQKFSRALTQFENALREGNAKVVKELFKNEMVLSDLRSYSKNLNEGVIGNILSTLNPYKNTFSTNNHFLITATTAKEMELSRLIIEKLIEESKTKKIIANYNLTTPSDIIITEDQAHTFLEEETTAKDHEYQFLGHSLFNSLLNALGSICFMPIFFGKLDIFKNGAAGMSGVSIYITYKYYNTGYSNLHNAAKMNDLQLIKLILSSKAAQQGVNDQTEEGQTALHIATKLNHTDIALYLISYNSNIYIHDYNGKLVLHYAVENNNYLIFNRLIEKGNKIDAIVYNSNKSYFDGVLFWSILYITGVYFSRVPANGLGYYGAWLDKFFIGNVYKHAVNLGNIKLPEHLAFILGTTFLQLKFYGIIKGTDDSFIGYSQDSLLHIATRNNDIEFVTYILRAGANVNYKNKNNETPLHIAASSADYQSVIQLINYEANPNVYAYKDQSSFLYLFDCWFSFLVVFGTKFHILAKVVFNKFARQDNRLDSFQEKITGTLYIFIIAALNNLIHKDNFLDLLMRTTFIKLIHQDKFFESLQEINLGTPILRVFTGNKAHEILQNKYI